MENIPTIIKGMLMDREFNMQYYGDCLMLFDIEESGIIETMGVMVKDRRIKLLINRKFLEELDFYQLRYVLAHEVLHVVLGHLLRDKDLRNLGVPNEIQNIGADMAVNSILGDPPIKDAVYPTKKPFEKYELGKSFEEYVRDLLKDAKKNKIKGQKSMDDHSQWGDSEESEAVVKDMENKLREIAQKYKGKLSSQLESQLEAQHKIVNWKYKLRSLISASLSDRFTPSYTKPNRRFPDLVGIIPGKKREAEGKVFIFLDVSGSIEDDLLSQFVGVALSIPAPKEIYQIDTEIVGKPIKILSARGLFGKSFTRKAAGGTDFRPAFKLAKEKNAKMIVYFTDLIGDFPESDPGIKTIWVTPDGGKAPFGEVINMGDIVRK